MKRTYFGTDGVRGPYGGPVINEQFAERLGVAAARYLSRLKHDGEQRVYLGRDTRASGESLLNAIASGFASMGIQVISLGVVPTPAVSATVIREKAALGVMITASHNPASDNGIKFFGPSGIKLTDPQEFEIEQLLPNESPNVVNCSVSTQSGAIATYVEKMAALLPPHSLRGWKIVLDTAHGATCATSPAVLKKLGAEVIGLGDAPDGQNINAGLGSEHPEKMAARVKETGARLGIAHDGDGDRCILCDENGDILDGDEILTLLALHAQKKGKLGANALVITVQSNLGVDAALESAGAKVFRTAVGDRYVIERMLASGATLGGESSGHIICTEIAPTGDGLAAAIKVLEVMLATGKPLSELRKALKKFPQASVALKVKEKKPLETLPHFPLVIEALERELGTTGRLLIRYSGTEAKLRLLVEGPTDTIVQNALNRLITVAKTDLVVV